MCNAAMHEDEHSKIDAAKIEATIRLLSGMKLEQYNQEKGV